MKCLIFNVSSQNGALSGRNLGVYKIAHLLRTNGWNAEVIDYAPYWSLEELKQLVKSRYSPDMKFFGFGKLFDHWPEKMEMFAAWLKTTYPDLYIISGSQYHKNYDSQYIDYYVTGYGEIALLELLKYLFSNGKSPIFALSSNDKKKVINANTFYPAVANDSLAVIYEDRDFITSGESLTVEFSRGCKFACSFCDFPFLNVKGDPSRSGEDFEKEMRHVYDKFGVTKFICADSTFNDTTEKITKFADVVERLPFKPWFSGYIRADLLISRPRDREELLRMNFLGHYYGVETFNHESGKSIGKGMHPDKIKQGLLEVKDYYLSHGSGLYTGQISLIAGLPYETAETFKASLDWLEHQWAPQPVSLSPYMLVLDKNKTSEISKDYKKYNYRPISKSIDKQLLDKIYSILRDSGDYLIWENDYMNIIEAYLLCNEFRDRVCPGTYVTPFNIGDVVFNDFTIDQIVTSNFIKPLVANEEEREQAFIRNYINKKLSI